MTVRKAELRNPLDAPIVAIANRIGGEDKSKEVERFLKFAIVGTVGAVIDFGTLYILQRTLLIPTLQEPDWNVTIAQTIAFVAAVVSNFIWNRYWTYPDSRTRSVRRQLAQFAFISLVGWLARTIWITAAHQPVGELITPIILPEIHLFSPDFTPTGEDIARFGTMACWFVGVIIVMIWNFFANRYWTYNDVD
ncbi:MAG: GtrA family protein [Anaerolineae bacterium]|nr:GtrA family protein [Anaerolineae bacterium]